MAKTYKDIQEQIAKLQQEAEKLRQKEVKEVIDRIKTAIAHYRLTAEDLFGGKVTTTTKATTKRAARAKKPSVPKYGDESGNQWSGHGKRPNWFKAAIAAGKTPEDLLIR
jgi:DNA-binding protein H-NS